MARRRKNQVERIPDLDPDQVAEAKKLVAKERAKVEEEIARFPSGDPRNVVGTQRECLKEMGYDVERLSDRELTFACLVAGLELRHVEDVVSVLIERSIASANREDEL